MMKPRRGRSFDQSSAARAFSYAGSDPRIWSSFATVDAIDAGDGAQTVEFDEEDGQVYVSITLQPYNIPARARVAMAIAGAGEAMYFPFVPNDEVIVAIPSGSVRAGCVIVGKLNNKFDAFPMTGVSGTDPNNNASGVIRTRAALVIESAASVMIRSAAAGAFLRLDAKGGVTLRDGTGGAVQMTADLFGYQSGDGAAFLQIDLTGKRCSFQVGVASWTLSGSTADPLTGGRSMLQVPGPLTICTGGNNSNTAVEHVLTTEAFTNFLVQVFVALGVAVPGPLTGAAVATAIPAAIVSALPIALTAPQLAPVAAALVAAFAAATVKPVGIPGTGQQFPGVGSAGTLTG